jgi:hypothetical protein
MAHRLQRAARRYEAMDAEAFDEMAHTQQLLMLSVNDMGRSASCSSASTKKASLLKTPLRILTRSSRDQAWAASHCRMLFMASGSSRVSGLL